VPFKEAVANHRSTWVEVEAGLEELPAGNEVEAVPDETAPGVQDLNRSMAALTFGAS